MSYIIGHINNNVPVITTNININDIIGAIKVRWSINRNNYIIKPGLYAIGKPDGNSDVLVTANYKLSFDHVRKNLIDLNVWILVLDTKGINVWCAAGKGTFGTTELVSKINEFKLNEIVVHKRIILPQLGAVGVSAHEVKNQTGFNVKYGPVRATYLKNYISDNYKADSKMRTVNFNLINRLILTPIEIVGHLKYFVFLLSVVFILSCFKNASFNVNNAWNYFQIPALSLIVSYLTGTVVVPLLLPYIRFRNFSFKGMFVSFVISALFLYFDLLGEGIFENISFLFLNLSIASFTAMNFTGASTFTSLSGVKKEMKIAAPIQLSLFVLGIIIWITTRFI